MTAPSNARKLRRFSRRASSSFIILALSLALASSAFAQKNKKKNQADAPPPPSPMLSLPPEQQIDYMISELLGAWQVGDVEKLHSHCADDVSVVNGSWAPPIVGWPAYLASYQSQRARTQQVRLDRLNTLVRVDGNFAWASYQWDFSGVVDGTPTNAGTNGSWFTTTLRLCPALNLRRPSAPRQRQPRRPNREVCRCRCDQRFKSFSIRDKRTLRPSAIATLPK
jgi:ketosteroid isomerase-like protein